MKKITFMASAVVVLLLIATSCSEDGEVTPIDPNEGLVEIGSQQVPESDYQIKMFLPEGTGLEVGYNRFAMALFDGDGNHVTNAHLDIMPMMTMTDMSHSSPYEVMEHMADMEEYQQFAAVFVMPSGEMGTWTLETEIHVPEVNFTGTASLSIDVENPEISKMKAMDLGENGRLFISLVDPIEPIVGSNDFEVVIHQRESMMSWTAVTSYSLTIEPEMPAMGHGSPNNENPVHDQLGHYKGIVNFTMTGEWVVHLVINDGETLIAETEFEIVF